MAGIDDLEDLWREHDVTFAYVFGSRAEGTATRRSDHDVAVMFGHPPTLLEVGALQSALVSALGTDVDLVELDGASLELQARVVQRGRLVYSSDEPRRVSFEVITRSLWFDYEPTLRRLTRAYLDHVARSGLAS
jgi:predicted nucleotidyltransferase